MKQFLFSVVAVLGLLTSFAAYTQGHSQNKILSIGYASVSSIQFACEKGCPSGDADRGDKAGSDQQKIVG